MACAFWVVGALRNEPEGAKKGLTALASFGSGGWKNWLKNWLKWPE
jgi:hypothetical protein